MTTDGGWRWPQANPPLAKVYVELTTRCNLACRTCVRNVWDEPTGTMTAATFARVIEGIRALPSPPTVFFGGLGEPLLHPQVAAMVAQAKHAGARVELITNGTRLNETMARRLLDAELDVLWVSLDGSRKESYADIRLGASLPVVVRNVARLRDLRQRWQSPQPEVGIVFVAMKRNIADLPNVLRLGRQLGAAHFLVTNILPYAPEMCDEVLYNQALSDLSYQPSPAFPRLQLPPLDVNATTGAPLLQALQEHRNVTLAGGHLAAERDRCPFIEAGATAIRWDGQLSPCLPLLHHHVSYINRTARTSRPWLIGPIAERSLGEMWALPEYVAFRQRVEAFAFSPCARCGGCDLSTSNTTDCSEAPFPSCGGCLWAQGVVRCP